MDYISDEDKKRIFWVPTILGKFKASELNQIWENSNEQLIYKHDFLNLFDYLIGFGFLFRLSLRKKSLFVFQKIDVTPLIMEEFKSKRFDYSTFEGILNYIFIYRLRSKNIDLKLYIDWHENQAIDKGFIQGIKTFSPKVHTKGYQGYIISTDYNLHLLPTDYEINNKVIPDEICVIGKALKNNIKKFSSNMSVSTAPAFRYHEIYNNYKTTIKNYKRILIILPIGILNSFFIIKMISEYYNSIKTHQLKFYLKLHPSLNFNKLKKILGAIWDESIFIKLDMDMHDAIINSDLVIGSESSSLVEALTYGIPVIIIANQNDLTPNPIPIGIKKTLWSICFDINELKESVQNFLLLSIEIKMENKRYGQKIKKDYFKKISYETVKSFLDI